MSGITPLIDTLLHQVLGKRADVPPPRDLNQPVKPVAPGDAPRALHSDSRLEARATPGRALPTTQDAARAGVSVPSTETPLSASTHTHFSTTARAIADLLLRFPAPASAIVPAAPLVSTEQSLSPSLLAHRLEGSVRDSGLFYESHLARWFSGGLSRQQLEREPQMWRTLSFSPVATSAQALKLGGAPLSGSVAMADASGALTMETLRVTAAERVAVGMAEHREPVNEHLQGLVRHQLEMLVTPTLRWEGDVWSGLFMALAVHLPHEGREQRRQNAASPEHDQEGRLRSELSLEVEGLGAMRVTLRMGADALDVALQARDTTLLSELEAELDVLRQRLERHGFDQVQLRVEAWENGE